MWISWFFHQFSSNTCSGWEPSDIIGGGSSMGHVPWQGRERGPQKNLRQLCPNVLTFPSLSPKQQHHGNSKALITITDTHPQASSFFIHHWTAEGRRAMLSLCWLFDTSMLHFTMFATKCWISQSVDKERPRYSESFQLLLSGTASSHHKFSFNHVHDQRPTTDTQHTR